MRFRLLGLGVAVALSATLSIATAADSKDERGGSCEDAKKQFDYFCNKTGNQNDVMMQAPIACNNAKRNMAAACEGKAEPDKKYEFDDKKS
jgi:hypothetical protein